MSGDQRGEGCPGGDASGPVSTDHKASAAAPDDEESIPVANDQGAAVPQGRVATTRKTRESAARGSAAATAVSRAPGCLSTSIGWT